MARVRMLTIAGLALLLGLAVAGPALAQGGGEAASVEVRVWQHVDDERDLYVSARAAGGSWRTLGTVPLALDGLTANEIYRYGDIALALPQGDGEAAEVELRVWQDASLRTGIFVSVRLVGSAWSVPGTAALPLDDGITASGRYRYGNVRLVIPPKDAASGETAWPDAARSDIPSVAIEFEGDFKGTERAWTQELERHFNSAAAFFAQRYGLAVPGLTIRMVPSEEGPPAYAGKTIFMTWDSVYESVIAHEYVHAIQHQLAVDSSGPAWMSEGMATYFEQKFAEVREERIVSTLDEARLSQDSLRSKEEKGYWNINYSVSSLAVHQLVLLAGEEAIFDFYSSLRNRNSWHEAFRDTFGVTVDKFYEQFASYRADVAPPFPEIRGVVFDLDSNPVPHFTVRVSRLTADHRGIYTGAFVMTDTYGRFHIPIRSGKYVLGVSHPDCGDAGFLDDDGSFTRSRDEARIFEIGDSNLLGVVVNLPADPAQPCAYSGSRWWEWWRSTVDVDEPERMSGVGVAFFAGLPGTFTGRPRLTDGPAESARFSSPMGMALTASGDVIVADYWNDAIRSIAPDGMVTTVAGGNGEGARDGPGQDAQFAGPADVAVHEDGSIYVADSRSGRIRRIATDGVVTTVTGGGPITREGPSRDGLAAEARFVEPFAIIFDRGGNLLIADRSGGRIRVLSPNGRVSTLAMLASTDGIFPTGIASIDGTIFFTGGHFTDGFTAIGMIDDRGKFSTILQTSRGRVYGRIAVGPDAVLDVVSRGDEILRVDRDGSMLSAIHVEGAHQIAGVVRMDDGALLVSDAGDNTIWRITFDAE